MRFMNIKIDNKDFQVNDGVSLESIIKKNFKNKNIVAARVNEKLQDLSECIKKLKIQN